VTVVWIALAGGLGSAARYLVGIGAVRWLGVRFPYGTLAVNVLGSIAIGLVFAIGAARDIDSRTQLILATGFLGGFTTYSAFAYESVMLLERRGSAMFALYVGATLAAGVAGAWLGLKVGRLI
jgi:CrcB protein